MRLNDIMKQINQEQRVGKNSFHCITARIAGLGFPFFHQRLRCVHSQHRPITDSIQEGVVKQCLPSLFEK